MEWQELSQLKCLKFQLDNIISGIQFNEQIEIYIMNIFHQINKEKFSLTIIKGIII